MVTKKKAAAKPGAKPASISGGKTAHVIKNTAKNAAPLKVTSKKTTHPASKPVLPASKNAAKKVALSGKPLSTQTTAKNNIPIKHPGSKAKVFEPIVKSIIKRPVAQNSVTSKTIQSASNSMAKKEETKKSVAKPAVEKITAPSKPAADVKAKDIKVPVAKPVIIPKISTKTVRKYQPDFTKSVLDKSERDPGAPTQRYSDPELIEFRELIQRKLEAAKKELSYLHGLITRKDEMGGDEGDNRYMTMEDGSLSMEREQLSQMASRQITFIDHLEKAIMRIENKTYGICRVTGKLIDKARLRAVPHATLSIEAKMGAAK